MKHFLPRDLKCHIFPAVTFWWQNAAALWKQFLLLTLSLFRTSVICCAFRGLSSLWRIMLLRCTGNSFEELRNQMCFFPWLEQEFSYNTHVLLFLFCMKPSLSKPESRSKRVYARRRWGRSFPWLKVIDPISGGDIPPTENNNLCWCLEVW